MSPPGRYKLRQATFMDLVRTAYVVDADTIFGPTWLERDRFDVIAKAHSSTSQDNLRLMFRSLLADRFQLAIHEDRRLLPESVLLRGKSRLKLNRRSSRLIPNAGPFRLPNPHPA